MFKAILKFEIKIDKLNGVLSTNNINIINHMKLDEEIKEIFPSSFPPNKWCSLLCKVKYVNGQLSFERIKVFLSSKEGRFKKSTLPFVVP